MPRSGPRRRAVPLRLSEDEERPVRLVADAEHGGNLSDAIRTLVNEALTRRDAMSSTDSTDSPLAHYGAQVTVTVDLGGSWGAQTFTLTADARSSDNPRFYAPAAEAAITDLGRQVVEQVAAVHGDIRDTVHGDRNLDRYPRTLTSGGRPGDR